MGCPCCEFHRARKGRREVMRCMDGLYEFDVDLAKRLAGRRRPEPVDPDRLGHVISRRRIYRPHVHHADPARPGLVGTIRAGAVEVRVLLDGAHRAARALRDGVPFRARVLSAAETRRCLVE